MLTKQVFKEGIENLIIFYPSWNVKTEESKAMKAWYDIFSNMEDEQFKKMIDNHICKEKFNPTVNTLISNKPEEPKPKQERVIVYKEV